MMAPENDMNEMFTISFDDASVITVPIDDTLSNSGEAADAKAVGDALALKAAVSHTHQLRYALVEPALVELFAIFSECNHNNYFFFIYKLFLFLVYAVPILCTILGDSFRVGNR